MMVHFYFNYFTCNTNFYIISWLVTVVITADPKVKRIFTEIVIGELNIPSF